MRPYNPIVHPRGWRAFMEYGNGIMGDMCIHMLDMVRWMLDLGWPKRISSTGGILVDKASKANIPDTQTATFDFGDLDVVWQHRTWGEPPDPKYPWGATFYGDKGTLKASVNSYDFIPLGGGTPIHRDVTYELEQYPEDKTEKDLERHVAPAIRGHMNDFLAAIALARQAGGRHRARLHLDGELHPGQPGAAARPDADLGRREGPGRRRRRGQPAACAGPIASPGCIPRSRRLSAARSVSVRLYQPDDPGRLWRALEERPARTDPRSPGRPSVGQYCMAVDAVTIACWNGPSSTCHTRLVAHWRNADDDSSAGPDPADPA